MSLTKLLVATPSLKENLKFIPRTILLILLFLTACSPKVVSTMPPEIQNTTIEIVSTPTIESMQTPTSTPEEQVYPYYLPLATKPDVPPQTINGVTAEIDWAYVDESRVALHYTISGLDWPDGTTSDFTQSARVTSATIPDDSFNGAVSWGNLPVENGVMVGSLDQFLSSDGVLDADEHPTVDLRVDIPVEGPSSAGPFHFEFNVPVLDGIKIENVDQTVVANDVSMTLKTLVLNPSRAEVLICFQMPSAVDWGLTASTITLGGREFSFSGGGLLPGTDGKDFLLTDPERCSTIGFDISHDESVNSITLTVPKLVASIPEVVDQERVKIANQRLADRGIEFDYVNVDHGGRIEVLKRPAGATDQEIYPLIWDALAEQYEGPWIFTIPLER